MHKRMASERTPEGDFWTPILVALEEMRGQAEAHRVIDRVGEMLAPVLTVKDKQRLSGANGQIRWRNTACWARDQLIKEGLLDNEAPWGTWRLTQKAHEYLYKLRRAA